MTIPRISGLLIMLAMGHDAMALQMGQMSSESVRGQPLMARVTLFGMPAASAADLSAEVLPAFGTPRDTLAVLGMQARVETDDYGVQAIVITTRQRFEAASLSLRVRLKEGSRAVMRHYELNVPAAPAPAARATATARQGRAAIARPIARAATRQASNNATTTSPVERSASYGPVRAGQSLWSILKETGLAKGDSRALMQDIVAANPQAFVNGNATRLRVGVSLQLPSGARATGAAPSASANIVPATENKVNDAETAARLQRLAVQFAGIRARYAAQKQQQAVARNDATTTGGAASTAVTLAPAASGTAASAKPVERRTTPADEAIKTARPAPKAAAELQRARNDSLLDTLAAHVDGKVLMALGASLLFGALLLAATHFGRRLRSRMTDAGVRSADREMVAEIARKTEKRVQLEGEVKRMIAGRRDSVDEAAPGMLRPADLLAGPRGSLEDIETRIAHGQYNEAEAMLEATIADTPNNYRAKLRLAEIYYLNERHEEFVDLADEIHRQHRSDIGDENWARLMRMGKVIAPDRPPFSGPVAVSVEAGRRAR